MPKEILNESEQAPNLTTVSEKTTIPGKDNIDDEFFQEKKMSYSADSGFSSSFHDDAYSPENYNYFKDMMLAIQKHLDVFVVKNPQFDNLRTLDTTKLRAGDKIGYNGKAIGDYSCVGKTFIINEIKNDRYFVVCNGTKDKFEFKPGEIKVLDELILRLKNNEISFIYNDFKEGTNTESHTDFFYSFTEYFKINEKVLYESLSSRVKNEILEELDERTGCLKKMNNFEW